GPRTVLRDCWKSVAPAERLVVIVWTGSVAMWCLQPLLFLAGFGGRLITPLWQNAGLFLAGTLLGLGALVVSVVAWTQMGDSGQILTSSRPVPLVTSGIFTCVRHPIYAAQASLLIATLLLQFSPFMVATAVIHICCVRSKAALEEKHLNTVYGEPY